MLQATLDALPSRTMAEQIATLEVEIDARVAALYGLDPEGPRWAAQSALKSA